MADSGQPPKPGLVGRILSLPRRLSLAAYLALLTAVVLLTLAVITWIVFYATADNVHDALSWQRIAMVLALILVIPWLVYRGLRLWLEGDMSRFPDVDYAWSAGVEAARQHGVRLGSVPIFLVIGSSHERQEQALMRASGRDFRLRDVPEGSAPLHWYADAEGVFLFCTETSWLSALATLAEKKPPEPSSYRVPRPAPPPRPANVAPATAAGTPAIRPDKPAPPALQGTVLLDRFVEQQAAFAQAAATGAPAASRPLTRDQGTVDVVDGSMEAHMPFSTPPAEDVLAVVPPLTAAERLRQLQYVCRLLRRERQPLCGINGILTLLPFSLLQASAPEVEELQRAIKSDLLTIQRELQVRCPVTALVVGLDQERGFSELVRRVGPERAQTQRFGRKFDVRCPTERNELAAYCDHVCGTFEDWVHALFREDQALTRPGNTRLYGLLCKVRCTLKTCLAEILAGGFGYDPRESPEDDAFLFSGCYFAATGESSDRQAFVRGVIAKLNQEQNFVEWSRSALAANQRYRWLAVGGIVASGVLAVTLLLMVAGVLR